MSDFIFSTGRVEPAVLQGALERKLGFVTSTAREYHGEWGSLAVVEAPHDRAALVETETDISVVVGTPVVEFAGDRALVAESNRATVHRLLASENIGRWDEHFDGVFAALHVSKTTGHARVITDLFAWIPIYAARAGDATIIGTHVDAVAEAANLSGQIDEVSVADRIAYSTVTWPYTLYSGVTQLAPASETGLRTAGAPVSQAYWQPVEQNPFSSIDDAAIELRTALGNDVCVATQGIAEIGVLLSGGEDSRALLGLLPDRTIVTAFTYAPSYNREVRSAARVAHAYGVRHRHGLRPETHDLEYFEPAAYLASSQNAFRDVHGYELHERLGLSRLPLVLGAFSSDALLKADNVPPKSHDAVRRGGSSARPIVLHNIAGVRHELLEAAAERRRQHRDLIAIIRPESADEWRYIWPFTMRSYAANIHGNRRLFAMHEPFMSNAVVRIAAAVPQRWKVQRQLFARAVRPLLKESWHIPHSRNRLPYFGATGNLVARPLLGFARDVRSLITGQWSANQESWPIWSKVVQTDLMSVKLAQYPPASSALKRILEPNVDADRVVREWTPLRQLNALQIAFLTR